MSMLFQKRAQIPNRTIVERPSWLVTGPTGQGLFVTESEAFLDWYLATYPTCTSKEVTGHVAEALAATAR